MASFDPVQPRRHPDEDRLGYKPFAQMLANSIEKMIPPEGLVIAIYGEWGSGKSTVVEFIKSYLEAIEGDSAPVVISFNPWWYSGSERLLSGFFDTLESELNSKFANFKKVVGDNLKKLARIAARGPIDGLGAGEALVDEYLTETLSQTKSKLAQQLSDLNKRIVIIIDDIDRLTPPEIMQLFAVIKSVADFPNVVYLLAFDEQVVSRALGDYGFDYIEKIVQVPFKMPLAGKDNLQKLFLEGLEEIVGNIPEALIDRFWNTKIYLNAVTEILDTPRHVIRLLNTFRVTYPAFKAEVHTVDFLFIEIIRVFYPQIYEYIESNQEFFTSETVANADISIYGQLLAGVKESSRSVDILLKAMFPKFDMTFPINRRDISGEAKARSELRIRSNERFHIYFGVALKDEQTSQEDILDILASIEKPTELTKKLKTYAELKYLKLSSLLENIYDYSYSASTKNLINLLVALLDSSDSITEKERGTSDGKPVSANLRLLTLHLLHRVTNTGNAAFEIIWPIFEATPSMSFLFDILSEINFREGWFPVPGQNDASFELFPREQLKNLNDIAAGKLLSISAGKLPIQMCDLIPTIDIWFQTNPEVAYNWLVKALKDADNVFDFISCYWNTDSRNPEEGTIDSKIYELVKPNVLSKLLTPCLLQYEGEKLTLAVTWRDMFLTEARLE